MLLLAGLFGIIKAALTAVGLVVLLAHGSTSMTHPVLALGAAGSSGVAVVLLWLLVLRHHRWARTLLMALCTGEAVTQLSALGATGRLPLLPLVSTGAAVLILIAVSSNASRRWVHLGSRHPH